MKLRALSTFACVMAPLLAMAGCPSSDNGPAGASDDGPEEAIGTCDLDSFLEAGGNGGTCAPVSRTRCFTQCNNDGCQCKAGPNGMGVWSCTTDTSCLADCGPLSDCGAVADDSSVDSSVADDGGDAADAVGDASDADAGPDGAESDGDGAAEAADSGDDGAG